ncbi:MAG TPA: GlsB/YeaQ/YmgE family stress response membrane protein [Thermodesulfobacteriota bacterium]|jgi:uncharacterized membrane protein YeaQ/YmgE (transglycosylase-associated protein family)
MGIISWIILGLIVGALAKWIMPGEDPGGIIITIVIGIVGALIGGFLSSLVGLSTVTGLNLWSIIIALVGALILLWLYRMVKGKAGRK